MHAHASCSVVCIHAQVCVSEPTAGLKVPLTIKVIEVEPETGS